MLLWICKGGCPRQSVGSEAVPKSPITNKPMKIKANVKRFFKKFAYRMASKILEIAVLAGIGYSIGLKLVRY